MALLPSLQIPEEAWLRSLNERYRQSDMAPEERPIRAMEEWAARHGQPADFGALALSHLGGPAWTAIDAFFRAHTKLGQERRQPLAQSVWFYDGSFYPINLIVILGGPAPVSQINPFRLVADSMPNSLLHDFSRDEAKVQEYLEHLSNALDSFASSDRIIRELKSSLARDFLGDAITQLDSAATGLLDTPPNSHAAGHARLGFETALKGFLAEKAGLTKEEAERKVRHRLDILWQKLVAAPPFIHRADLTAIKNAAIDSANAQNIFPKHDAHYDSPTFPNQRLWECYRIAQHTLAAVLRAFGASDSRTLRRNARSGRP
jgi:hypothetical protein